jgi:MFS superfamily sulfate permease-like transporter
MKNFSLGMGYSLIAHVNPVFGLYTAFFPALMYTILGTSRHCAVGPVAIVAGLMTGNVVIEVMNDLGMNFKDKRGIGGIGDTKIDNYNTSNIPEGFEDITNIDIAVMVGLINGVYIFVFGCLRLGFISNYLSEELVSGFMTSAAIYVFTTQIHYIVGIDLANQSGPLALIRTYIEFFERIKEVNLAALTTSLICIAILIFYMFVVQKLLLKYKIKMPFPIHLFIMIGGIIASNLMDLENEYQVQIVGDIPST